MTHIDSLASSGRNVKAKFTLLSSSKPSEWQPVLCLFKNSYGNETGVCHLHAAPLQQTGFFHRIHQGRAAIKWLIWLRDNCGRAKWKGQPSQQRRTIAADVRAFIKTRTQPERRSTTNAFKLTQTDNNKQMGSKIYQLCVFNAIKVIYVGSA